MAVDEEQRLGRRIKRAWNAFNHKDEPKAHRDTYSYGIASQVNGPYRTLSGSFYTGRFDKTIITSIYNRLATDICLVNMQHVRVDENDGFVEKVDSGLNNCLTLEANIDQTAREFRQDLALSLFDEGSVAVVPVDTVSDIREGSFDIITMRVAKIVDRSTTWVTVECYNDQTGRLESLKLPKRSVAIINNPFYDVMNSRNGTLQRLTDKLNKLDVVDDQTSSGKLDLIIQLPYAVKTPTQRNQAEMRRKAIEEQLVDSKYGIAYTDGTERITQLNRPVENNLMTQVEYLTNMLYSQLGLTAEIMNGTANEQTMLNYYDRTINPFLNAIADEFERKFLTRTARTQHQAIRYYREPFSLTTSEQIADLADRLIRNEVLSPNEMRSVIGFRPVNDDRANELRNRNLNASDEQLMNPVEVQTDDPAGGMVDEGGGVPGM